MSSASRHMHEWVTKAAVIDPDGLAVVGGADPNGQRVIAVVCASCKAADLAFANLEDAQERLQVLRRATLVNTYNGLGPARRARLARRAARNAAKGK